MMKEIKLWLVKRICICPGSNWGPAVCETAVITTTLQMQWKFRSWKIVAFLNVNYFISTELITIKVKVNDIFLASLCYKKKKKTLRGEKVALWGALSGVLSGRLSKPPSSFSLMQCCTHLGNCAESVLYNTRATVMHIWSDLFYTFTFLFSRY